MWHLVFDNKMATRNYIFIAASVVVIAAIAVGAWFSFVHIRNQQPSPYTKLLQTNTDFTKAQLAFNNGRFTESIDLYKQALSNTTDTDQRLAIYYYLAAAENIAGQHAEAIQLLKQVVAAKSISNEIRAYAAQYMGIMSVNLSNTAAHNLIMGEIFKDSPYKEMLVQGNDALSSRHLFEYASSLYPLGVSEANIANWYIGNIIANKISTTTEPGLSNIKLIERKLANVDADIKRTTGMTGEALIPQAYARKAEAVDALSQVGAASKEQALKAYADALQSYVDYGSLTADDWFLRFRYSNFLARVYGQSRQKDIHAIVAPLYTDPAYVSLSKPFFTTLSGVRLTQTPTTAIESNALRAQRIGRIDSDFKNFLISVGWSKNKF